MAKKSPNNSQARSLIGTILAAIVLLIAVLAGGITGEDLNVLLDMLGQPTLVIPTSAPVTVTPPATIAPGTPPPTGSSGVTIIPVGPQGFGAERDFWQVYFNAPSGSRDASTYVGGIDTYLATAINGAQTTVDMAAFEFNSVVLTQALLDAHQRGVRVRMVTDDEHGLEDDLTTIGQLIDAGIPVRDDNRSGLMHNKFTIIDGREVWSGSMNYTINGAYRNNNNLIMLRSNRAILSYQAEFNEMFGSGAFGPRSSRGNSVSYTDRSVPIQTLFAAEDDVLGAIIGKIDQAQTSIHFMAFSFTEDAIGDAVLERANAGTTVQGIFERVGSETTFSELTRFFCAGLDVRQDGNPFILHHKVIIVDERIVLTGSFNFSQNATTVNDENMLIIEDPALAQQYMAEFERRLAESLVPDSADLTCS